MKGINRQRAASRIGLSSHQASAVFLMRDHPLCRVWLHLSWAAASLVLCPLHPSVALAQVEGHVLYVTRGDVFVDRGALDGLTPGQVLTLQRMGDEIATVQVSHTSDRRASARVQSASTTIHQGDTFAFSPPPPSAPAEQEAPAAAERTAILVPEAEWPSRWRAALASAPRTVVRYQHDRNAERAFRFEGRAASRMTARAALDAAWLARQEQSVFLRARAEDLGHNGLDLVVRGALDIRYDDNPDRYLGGQRAIPLFREVALRYAPGGRRVAASIGRFRPAARNVGIVDGGEAAWHGSRTDFSLFGGLRPAPDSLLPRAVAPAFGGAATWHGARGDETWRVSGGAASTFYQASASRQSIYLDSGYTRGETWVVRESATVDYVPAGASADGQSGLDLADGTLLVVYGSSPKRRIELSMRYAGHPLYLEEMDLLPGAWPTALAGRTLTRIDLGFRLQRSVDRSVKPYLYYFQEGGTSYDEWVVAGGVRYRRDPVAGLAVEAAADYGDGTRQQARLDLGLSTRVAGKVWLGGGILDQWTFAHDSGLHTFQHIGYARASSMVVDTFQLWAMALGAFDHDLLLRSPGGWVEATGGFSFTW